MKLIYLCVICLNFSIFASTQNLRIQVQPLSVNLKQDDLVVTCSIINPSQLSTVYTIQLQKNNSNSNTMENVVSVNSNNGQDAITWQDTDLQNRASVEGTLSSPAAAQLKLTIPKDRMQCPQDFTGYSCKMSGFYNGLVNQDSNQMYVSYIVHPSMINMPTVRILGEFSNTPAREFPVGTAIQLTCEGQIGSDASATIRWCAKKSQDFTMTGLPQTPIHSQATPAPDCQYTRSSTITYNLTSDDTYTQFLCESGYSGLCETGTAKQYLNITLEGTGGITNPRTAEDTSDAGIIAGGVIGGLAFLILVILLVYFLVLRRKSEGETYRTKEDVPGYNGPANPEGPVYSVPVKDHPPERQPRKKHPRDHEDDSHRRRHRGHENEGLDDDHTEKREMEDDEKYNNHGYTNRVMNDYNDGDVMPRAGQGFGSAV